jgi:NAD+ diphosphatase
MLVHHDGQILLGRQSRFIEGTYSCLAGFVEPGESIEEAARREIFEESGIRVGEVAYHSSQPWPFPSNLMIGLIGEALGTELDVDYDELEDARWFPIEEVRMMQDRSHPDGLATPPDISIAHQLIRWFLAQP